MNLLRKLSRWEQIGVEQGKELEQILQRSSTFHLLSIPDSGGSIVQSYYRITRLGCYDVHVELEHVLEPWDEPLLGPYHNKQRMAAVLCRTALPAYIYGPHSQ